MKKLLLLAVLPVMLMLISCKPSPEKLLKRATENCRKIDHGFFEMVQKMKYSSVYDTSFKTVRFYFKKLPEDTIFSLAFHKKSYHNDSIESELLYTGSELITYLSFDSSSVVMSNKEWSEDINNRYGGSLVYSPVTKSTNSPLPNDSAYFNDRHHFEFLGKEKVNDKICYHIKMKVKPSDDSGNGIKILRKEVDFWISRDDNFPLQYSIDIDLDILGDTSNQYEKNTLVKYDFNKDYIEELMLSSLPAWRKQEDYVPFIPPELLSINTMAPDVERMSIDNEKVSIADLRGHIILLDFFFEGCYPCRLAIPELVDLYEKYKEKGLVVIGVDPTLHFETQRMKNFLSNQRVNYPVILNAPEVAKEYNVYMYPSFYLINKEGKIIHAEKGYYEGFAKELEEVIKQNL